MKWLYSTGICASAVLSLGMVVSAQATATRSQSATTTAQQSAGDQQMTVTGCIAKESDYRRAQDAGRGGVAGTGIGAGNEFILTNAAIGPATGATGTTGSSAGAATGTAGTTAAAGTAYELTGPNEGDASKFVGQRVEISGTLKAAETTASGRPTGGPTAGAPPSGVDVGGKDLKLRELEVRSIRQVAGTCPTP